MGRYYSGDIEGKFWFGVQDSTDANFFGGQESEPNYLEYYFDKDDLPTIKKGIEKCKEELGEWQKKITDFFNSVEGYNDRVVKEAGLDVNTFNDKLVWYARLELGEKILDYVEKHGQCHFEAEL